MSRRWFWAISREGKGPTRALLSEKMPLIIREATKGGGPEFLLAIVFPCVRGRVYGGRAPRVIQRGGGRVGFLGFHFLGLEGGIKRG